MNIEQIIFKILQSNAHTWVRYWLSEKIEGTTMPGEYIEIRSSYLSDRDLEELFAVGFKIHTITTQKINADSYSDVLLKRELINLNKTLPNENN
jgi:hypothetical protein